MEIVVTGRHVQIPDRFREQLDERLAKVSALAPKVHRIDVVGASMAATQRTRG